jgi:hypothetical protein
MKRIAAATVGLLLFGVTAGAAPTWSVFSFTTTPQNAAKVLEAANALMSSDVGTEFPGRLYLQQNTVNGSDPATHSFVPVYGSAAAREEFVEKLQASSAWTTFQAAMTAHAEPVASTLHRLVKRWGDINDTDTVWAVHAFTVRDPAAFLAALEKLMASETGKKFPGQVYLSSVTAGGISPVSHVISVGYASETEMDAWFDVRDPSSDWAAYLDAARPVSEFLGTSIARTVKTWGPATLTDLTTIAP